MKQGNQATVGLVSAQEKHQIPFSNTPVGKFCFEIFAERKSAMDRLQAGDVRGAMVHLEYMETILSDSMAALQVDRVSVIRALSGDNIEQAYAMRLNNKLA